MDNLWSFIKLSPESPEYVSLADFSRLPAPRQAEWFNRELRELYGPGIDVAALRLHLLGRVIHPDGRIVYIPTGIRVRANGCRTPIEHVGSSTSRFR